MSKKNQSATLTNPRDTRATVDLTQVDIHDLVAAHTPRHEIPRTPPKAISDLSAVQPAALELAAPTPVGQVELPSVLDVVGSPPLHESPEPFVDASSHPVSRMSAEEAGADDTLLEVRRFDDLFVPGERASSGATDAHRDRESVDLIVPPLPSSELIAAPSLAPVTSTTVASVVDVVVATGAYSVPSSAPLAVGRASPFARRVQPSSCA